MTTNFLSKISFVSKIADIMKATSDDETPIPGYLYKEVSGITTSSIENCETCVEFLVDRLSHDSNHVKLKVLKLMKYIVENGHPNFRLGLIKKSTGIREATKHSGPPDPLHGDVPYKMVRKHAQDLLEKLFDVKQSNEGEVRISPVGIGTHRDTHQGQPETRMEGYGSSPNTPQNKTIGEAVKDSLLKMADRLGDGSGTQQRQVLETIQASKGYTPPTLSSNPSNQYQQEESKTASEGLRLTKVSQPRHTPGRAGGGWDDSDDGDDDVIDDIRQKSISESSNNVDSLDRLVVDTCSDSASETALVQFYLTQDTQPTNGLLTLTQCRQFLQDCSALNCDRIINTLNTYIADTDDGGRVLCSLQLLETLMYSDLVSLERLVISCKDSLVSVTRSATGQSASKARKVFKSSKDAYNRYFTACYLSYWRS
ncbi:AP-4 complex accessory subunit tepsin-like isoform X2 [Dreissena polymorpha]|uniref:AP-4 complex accessory subunit tepsin-like isoform X2 n=1 Tax=Dreissena polymorpha TaxID=45954 RepID=UPI002263EF01|nr:AP-4 complex accessory subunit tepsin-like isoform X2 [Dreissena polymorpha]